METNLKNRPKLPLKDPEDNRYEVLRDFAINCYEWFEGFEKELEEMLELRKKWKHWGKVAILEEILGFKNRKEQKKFVEKN